MIHDPDKLLCLFHKKAQPCIKELSTSGTALCFKRCRQRLTNSLGKKKKASDDQRTDRGASNTEEQSLYYSISITF